MAKQTKPLSDTEIKAAKPQESDYTLHDGDGLQLLIKTTGSKIWQFRYYRPLNKARAKLTFGAYPSITLQDARKLRAEARALVAKNIDPKDHQREQLRAAKEARANTFQVVAKQWWDTKKLDIMALS